MNVARSLKIAFVSAIAIAMTTEAFAFDAAAIRSLNVRTGPGTGYRVVDTLQRGEVVEVSECNGAGWCMIQHRGPDGWVSARYLNQAERSGVSSNDAALAVFLGITALAIGGAIASGNHNQPHHPAPPPPPPYHPYPHHPYPHHPYPHHPFPYHPFPYHP